MNTNVLPESDRLLEAARKARELAYVPYSHFPVGAAIRVSGGEIITGCNIENASFGLTNCAERTAVFKAVSEGKGPIEQIAVIADTRGPCAPCGMCRQVLAEFCGPDTPVLLSNLNGNIKETTVGRLLPDAFGKEDLDEETV